MKAPRKQFSAAKRFRFRVEYALIVGFGWLLPKLPRRFLQHGGHALGWLAFHLWSAGRKLAMENLGIAFGDTLTIAEKKRIARRSLQNIASTLLTMFWMAHLDRETFHRIVDVDEAGLKLFQEMSARGKGVVCITPHFGDWEMLGLSAGFLGLPMTVVQEILRNEALEAIYARLRGVSGNRIVPNRHIAMTLFKTLKRGGNVALLIDQSATRNRRGLWLDFFGLPVFNNAAAGLLALKTGAGIICGVAYPLPDGRVKLSYGPEITYTPTGDDDADIRAINQDCLSYCEGVIRKNPEMWMWCYKRWSYRTTAEQGRFPSYSRYVADIAG